MHVINYCFVLKICKTRKAEILQKRLKEALRSGDGQPKLTESLLKLADEVLFDDCQSEDENVIVEQPIDSFIKRPDERTNNTPTRVHPVNYYDDNYETDCKSSSEKSAAGDKSGSKTKKL